MATGERGFNLAAILLLGKDDVILNACPSYETDALVRKVNMDRYDDRKIIRTNLIESFDRLMEFGRKHLPDKFFLEDENRVSIRNILVMEMVGNTLMHREFTSSYAAKFVIQRERMYVENANRAPEFQEGDAFRIVAFCMTPRKRAEIAEYCGYRDVKHFTQNYLKPLLAEERIVMTIPDKPNSKNQRYLSAGKK